MNKLFTKIAALALGATMAVGVGAAVVSKEAKQVNAKQNISLYNLEKGGKYTYTNSDEAKEEDIVEGKWKYKRGVVIFTPSSINADDILLYTKDGHLCSDADCTKIYFRSDKSCNAE